MFPLKPFPSLLVFVSSSVLIELTDYFALIERGFVHWLWSFHCCLFCLVLYDTKAARLAPLIKTDTGVQDFAELAKSIPQLVPIHTEGQIAYVHGKGGSTSLRRRVSRLVVESLLNRELLLLGVAVSTLWIIDGCFGRRVSPWASVVCSCAWRASIFVLGRWAGATPRSWSVTSRTEVISVRILVVTIVSATSIIVMLVVLVAWPKVKFLLAL